MLGQRNKAKVHREHPYAGSNSYSGDAPSGYKRPWQGGGGNNAAISRTLSKS
ncbi:hypothetical protein [Streptomyces sp. NPDC088757]|uniref:hypothetical protein n=1 Tax=Streptomyces sp. NPDC088757 TaxID=3365889 RepID=UPI003808F461